jgi:hypothetical protein
LVGYLVGLVGWFGLVFWLVGWLFDDIFDIRY